MRNDTKLDILWEQMGAANSELAAVKAVTDQVTPLIPKIPKDYSTTEQDTGAKWIDGKAVYMKVLSGTLPEVTASGAFTISENMNINLLHISGVVLLDGFQVSIPYFNSTTYCGLRIRNTDKVLQAYISSTAFSERPYRFILLYTKPDTEPETKKATKKKTTKKEEE